MQSGPVFAGSDYSQDGETSARPALDMSPALKKRCSGRFQPFRFRIMSQFDP